MKLLLLEDSTFDAELAQRAIAAEWPDCTVRCVRSRREYGEELATGGFDVIVSDFSLGDVDGWDALRLARVHAPDTPVIFLSGTIGEERGIQALKSGAADCVLKDRLHQLVPAIRREIRAAEERRQRRRAEQRSRELTFCLDQAREAVVVLDLEGRVTFWNRGAEGIAGWSVAEAIGRDFDAVFAPVQSGLFRTICQSAGGTGEWSGEVEVLGRGQAPRLLECRVSLTRGEDQVPCAWLVLGTDISERRSAERRVREQGEMLNQAREAIFITDLEHRVLYWNAGAERLFGWSGSEVIGRTAEQIFEVGSAAHVQAAAAATLSHGHWHGEMRLQHRNRAAVIVESRHTLIRDDAGRPKARLCISTDITDRKRLEEQFLRAQRMENIGLLAAGVAHDLNNMLAPILLAAPMVRDHLVNPGALAMLTTLERSAERGAALVKQILSFAQGASGEQRPMQVRHLLRELGAVIRGTFPKSIRFEERIPADLWPIKGNPTQIHQVVLNLCVNARDAMPLGGVLKLRAENRAVAPTAVPAAEGARAGLFLLLAVEDSGLGITPDVMACMWDPFFTTKEADKGTGLGLSTVRGIVQGHGGFIVVRSEPGKGAAFEVYLPAADAVEPPVRPGPARVVPVGNGETILVVDDEHHVREMVTTLLTRRGYRVLTATDGAEAVAVFSRRMAEIRLVVTDLHMPNLDGATFGRAVRRMNPAVRVVVASGLSSPLGSRPSFAPEEFADAVLAKPFRPEELIGLVHDLLQTGGRPLPGGAAAQASPPERWRGSGASSRDAGA